MPLGLYWYSNDMLCIDVNRPCDAAPTLDDICSLESQASGAPVLTALVDSGRITFYLLSTASVVDISNLNDTSFTR